MAGIVECIGVRCSPHPLDSSVIVKIRIIVIVKVIMMIIIIIITIIVVVVVVIIAVSIINIKEAENITKKNNVAFHDGKPADPGPAPSTSRS